MDFKSLISYKDFTTLVQGALDDLKAATTRITNLNPGGVFRTLIELSMQGVADLYTLLLSVVPQGFAAHATGKWLNLKVKDVDLTRLAATKSVGTITFSRTAVAGAIRIPAGTIVKTDLSAQGEALRFFTTQDVIMPDGAAQASVPVQAEFPGARYNVGDGYIKNLVTNVPGIDSVTNAAGWITQSGTDEETDEALRRRYFLRWSELSQGGTDDAYISWALKVAGVAEASVNSEHPRGQGSVDVIITGPQGMPSAALISEVQAYIDKRRPNVANVLVKAPTAAVIDVAVTVQLPTTVGDKAATKTKAETLIKALFGQTTDPVVSRLRIGEDLYHSRLVALLMTVPNVVNVTIQTPAADVVVAPDTFATLGLLAVTVGRVAA